MSHGFNVLMQNLVLWFCEQTWTVVVRSKQDLISERVSLKEMPRSLLTSHELTKMAIALRD
jgi:hypothetical protein